MSDIIFAIVWIVFWCIPFIFIEINQVSLLLISIPLLVGFIILINALMRYIKNKRTKDYGEECYGIITDIVGTGMTVNGESQLKPIIKFINPETNQLETCECIVGYDPGEYPMASYVQCKYLKGTITIENIIFEENIPENIREYIVRDYVESSKIEFSPDREYVTIDGVEYKKIYDRIND